MNYHPITSADFSPGGETGFTRRHLLGAFGLAGALGIGCTSYAQTRANPRRVDFHHHFQPPEFLALAASKGKGTGRGGTGTVPNWTLSKDLEDMDQNGTATALLSIVTPSWFELGDVDTMRKAARICNEYAARLRADHPGRFGSFASIPLWYNDNEGALKEIEYAMDTLKAEGVGMYSNYGDRWLGDAAWAPVWQELNRRKAIVYIHPRTANCCEGLSVTRDVPNEGAMIEFGSDTTRAVANVVLNGVSSTYPGIRWVFSHAGGMTPFLVERFLSGYEAEVVPGIVTKGQDGRKRENVPRGPLFELRKLYYECAQSSNPVAMRALRTLVPVTQILFGTDFWFRTAEETGRGLTTSKIFTDAELRMINRGNAERMIPSLKGA